MLLLPLSMSIDLITLAYSKLRRRRTTYPVTNNTQKDSAGNKSVSVFIPIYNEAEKIISTINAIIKQTHQVKNIFLLDDRSANRTKQICEDLKRKNSLITHVRRKKKLGKAGNINALINDLGPDLGEFLLVVDGDVNLDEKCVEELVKHSDKAAVVTGFGYTKKPFSYVPKMLYEGRSWMNAVFSFRKRAQSIRSAVFVICGALTLYRKDVLKRVPIPERTLTEDTDYTWLLQEKGYRINYNRKAEAVGGNPDSFRGCWRRHERWFSGTFQNLYIHGFRGLKQSKPLFYSTILPGCIEVVPYSISIAFLPVIAVYYPNIALGIIIADLILSAPFLFLHRQGFWYAVNHLPDIYAYKYFGSVSCLYAGIKTTLEKLFGRTNRWNNNWEKSSGANIQPKRLTKRFMKKHLNDFLYLEKEWTALGEKAWNTKNFMLKNPKKWVMSSYANLNGKPVGYAIVSEISRGKAYLHKILADSDYQRLGIGSLLLNDVKKKCMANNIKKLNFKVRVNNNSANALYRKNNVTYLGTEISDDGVKRFLCELEL